MKKLLLISFITILITGSCILFWFFSSVPNLQNPADYTVEKLIFTNHDSLFLKKKTDVKEDLAIISTSSDLKLEPDTSTDFIYDISSSPLLYEITNDSLIIYTRNSSNFPVKFTSKIKIKQVELDNPSMMNLIDNKKYLKLNIKRIK